MNYTEINRRSIYAKKWKRYNRRKNNNKRLCTVMSLILALLILIPFRGKELLAENDYNDPVIIENAKNDTTDIEPKTIPSLIIIDDENIESSIGTMPVDIVSSPASLTTEDYVQNNIGNEIIDINGIILEKYNLPSKYYPGLDFSSFQPFMDYRTVTNPKTPSYSIVHSNNSYTDEYGLRRYNNDYLVALGSYYSTDIGDRFEVTLDTGKTFTVMMADGKWDIDCDENNMYTPTIDYNGEYAGNLLEFIMDKYSVSSEMYGYGSLDYYDAFKGSVIKMIYLGRDDSADWDTYY